MSERTTWTTQDEIRIINRLSRTGLRKYYKGLIGPYKKHWGDVDRKKVIEHLKERMG